MISLKNITDCWNEFFFKERPTEGMALFRIIWFGLIFAYYLLDIVNIKDFYGPEAIVSLSTSRSQFSQPHLNLFNLFHPQYEVAQGLFALYGIALFFSFLGLFTKLSITLAFIFMTSIHQRDIWLLSSAEVLMRTITLYLIFSPCGHSLSLDSWLGRYHTDFKKKKVWPLWTWRLIQIQLSVVYLWTFWHKLKGETWFEGSAVYYATRLESMTNFSIPFIMNSMTMMKLASWGTLLLEFALGALIWIKEFRKPLIYAGIAFHLGIEFFMSIPFFELFMISLLINFFTPEEIRSFVKSGKEKFLIILEDSTIPVQWKERIINTVRG